MALKLSMYHWVLEYSKDCSTDDLELTFYPFYGMVAHGKHMEKISSFPNNIINRGDSDNREHIGKVNSGCFWLFTTRSADSLASVSCSV